MTTYIASAQWSGTGLLNWIIGTGFVAVVAGVPAFRILAIWRGWVADD